LESETFEIILPMQAESLGSIEVWGIIDSIVVRAKTLLREYVQLPPWEVVEAAIKSAFKNYVVPIDIPRVPEFLEVRIEAALERIVIEMLRKFYDQVSREKVVYG
jgi:hypothetical protein